MSTPKVFISYSHDSEEHRERVLGLSERLRQDGIDTLLDRYVAGAPPEGWPRWMLNGVDKASHVLVVSTETYYRRFRGHEEPGKGKGVDWEGALITQELYESRSTTLKFIPILFSTDDERFIVEPLRATTHYTLTAARAYQDLYDFLLGQSGVEPGAIGSLKPKARVKGSVLTFGGEMATAPTVDITRIAKYAPVELIGREEELGALNQAWSQVTASEKGRSHVLTFVALGGEGKTSLVAKWGAELAHQDWPGCDAAFAWSFYSQGTREQVAASSDLFLKEALIFFGNEADKEFAASSAGAHEKGQRLARIVGHRRSLLILDGLEPLQYAPTSPTPGQLKDQGIAALLKGLAATSLGLCVVTTRYSLPDLRAFWQTTAPEIKLLRLSREAGVHLLKTFGVKGSERRNIPVDDDDLDSEKVNEFEKLVEDVKGHALTLTLLGGFLSRAFHGDIRQRDRVKFEKADEKMDGGHAFRSMAAYEQWLLLDGGDEGRREVAVLRLMGLFDRPADAGCLAALRSEIVPDLTEPLAGLADDDWEYCLSGLEAAKLLTVNRDESGALVSLDAHPHLREYFAQQLRTQQSGAWRAAHRRLYEHLCATTEEGDQPTLEDLQPLYQAVAHGCQAGLEREARDVVYFLRILRAEKFYSAIQLGAFGSDLGAIACFFEIPWSRISTGLPETTQAWMLNEAGTRLRALGRLNEAIEPMRAAVSMRVKQKIWSSAANVSTNLSSLNLQRGDVYAAVRDAEKSVEFADLSPESSWQTITHGYLGAALHQAGRHDEATLHLRKAEAAQIKRQPDYPLLTSLGSFLYCDLLLTEPECAAWRKTLHSSFDPLGTLPSLLLTCHAVSDRATQTLSWAESRFHFGLLIVALDHLTLGRTKIYAAILGAFDIRLSMPEIHHAVSGLRQAGDTTLLPCGLLTRAWLRFLAGVRTGPESAQEDLDEAWEIAERGPMKLFLADIHLHRARLFFREKEYPWNTKLDGSARGPKDDLEAAEKLINECGYHRRDEELADAKAAILPR